MTASRLLPVAGPRGRWAWALFALVAVIGVGAFIREMTKAAVPYLDQDLAVYVRAGRAVLEGVSVYGPRFADETSPLPFTYPPFAALVMAPVAAFVPYVVVQVAWLVASLLALAALVASSTRGLVAHVGRARRDRLVAIGLLTLAALPIGPVGETLAFGQIGIFLVLACVVDGVLLFERRSPLRGVLVGIAAAIKLTPALVAVHWFLTGQRRAAITAGLTTLGCWALAAVLMPADSATFFLRGVLFDNAGRIGYLDRTANQGLYGAMLRLFDGQPPTTLVLVVLVGVAVGGLWAAQRAHANRDLLAAVSIVGLTSVLVEPVAWQHHGVWVVPAIGALVGVASDRRRVAAGLVLLVALYMPTQGFQIPQIVGFTEYWVALYVVLIGALFATSSLRRPLAVPAAGARSLRRSGP